MDQDDQIGGALYEEIQKRRSPCTAADLSKKIGVREEKAIRILQHLCGIGIVAEVDNMYICAELVPGEPSPVPQQSSVPLQSQVPREPLRARQLSSVPPQSQVAIAKAGAVSKDIAVKSENQVAQYPVDQMEMAKTKDAFEKILEVLSRQNGPMKSHNIAKETQLGSGKSAVNRYLYSMESQGFLSKNGVEWTLLRKPKDEEVKVMAAQLAKCPKGKKNSTTSEDCACPNRGAGCNHYHYTQNITNNQYNIQVGDSNLFVDSGGQPKKSDD